MEEYNTIDTILNSDTIATTVQKGVDTSATVVDTISKAVETVQDSVIDTVSQVAATVDTRVVQDSVEVVKELTGAGLSFMIISWVAIIGLTLFCFKKTLSESEEKIVGPLEVEAEMDAEDKE